MFISIIKAKSCSKMHVHGIKTRKQKINPNLTCEKKTNKQTCETETQKHKYI